jgi:hypothetical protein
MGERLKPPMAEQTQPSPVKPEGSLPARHPGVPATDIETAALQQRSEDKKQVATEKPPSEPNADAVTILNNRRRPITNHHGKDAF